MTAKNCANPVYVSYMGMMYRCHKPTDPAFHNYGGRGITVCDRWKESFYNFAADMGDKPTKLHTLDRIDNNAGYSKENCRWATRMEQQSNRRCVELVTHNGKTQCMAAWARELGVNKHTMHNRFRRGWSVKRALQSGDFTPSNSAKDGRWMSHHSFK